MFKFFAYPILALTPIIGLTIYTEQLSASPVPVATMVYLSILLIVLFLERKFPWTKDWSKNKGDSGLDITYLILNFVVSHSALAMYYFLFPFRETFLPSLLSSQSFYIQYMIGLLIFDFGLYFVHRLSHGYGMLWRLHAIHHSSERIYSVNGQKRHLLHEMIEGVPGFIIIFALGISPVVAVLIIYTVSIHLIFQHANIDYRAGILKNIFSVAELHRWHHQRDWKDVQGNYGAVFSFWDIIFGTLLKQKNNPPSEVGLDDSPELVRLSLVKQHIWPFMKSN